MHGLEAFTQVLSLSNSQENIKLSLIVSFSLSGLLFKRVLTKLGLPLYLGSALLLELPLAHC